MNIVRVEGQSMYPYLQTGDLILLASTSDAPSFGTPVHLETRDTRTPFIHRRLRGNWIKSDRKKRPDGKIGKEFRVLSKLRGRYFEIGGRTYYIDFNHPLIRLAHRVQGLLSTLNSKRFLFFHRFASFALFSFGFYFREIENRIIAIESQASHDGGAD